MVATHMYGSIATVWKTNFFSCLSPAACHILECSDGLAQSVISTIGQAFELQFKQYLHSPPKTMTSIER